MKIKFESIEIIGYLDEHFRDHPWEVVCDSYRRLLYVGFPYHKPDSSIVFDVQAHCSFESYVGSPEFGLEVFNFLDTVRKEFPDA